MEPMINQKIRSLHATLSPFLLSYPIPTAEQTDGCARLNTLLSRLRTAYRTRFTHPLRQHRDHREFSILQRLLNDIRIHGDAALYHRLSWFPFFLALDDIARAVPLTELRPNDLSPHAHRELLHLAVPITTAVGRKLKRITSTAEEIVQLQHLTTFLTDHVRCPQWEREDKGQEDHLWSALHSRFRAHALTIAARRTEVQLNILVDLNTISTFFPLLVRLSLCTRWSQVNTAIDRRTIIHLTRQLSLPPFRPLGLSYQLPIVRKLTLLADELLLLHQLPWPNRLATTRSILPQPTLGRKKRTKRQPHPTLRVVISSVLHYKWTQRRHS